MFRQLLVSFGDPDTQNKGVPVHLAEKVAQCPSVIAPYAFWQLPFRRPRAAPFDDAGHGLQWFEQRVL
jgi:hypothetical protein